MNPLSIYDNYDYRSYLPNLFSDMVPLPERPLSFGHSIDLGLLEKLRQNLARTGFILEMASDFAESVKARGMILVDTYQCCYGQLDRWPCMTSMYNTGHLVRAPVTGIPCTSGAPLSRLCPPNRNHPSRQHSPISAATAPFLGRRRRRSRPLPTLFQGSCQMSSRQRTIAATVVLAAVILLLPQVVHAQAGAGQAQSLLQWVVTTIGRPMLNAGILLVAFFLLCARVSLALLA
jgi:hypothetical protein